MTARPSAALPENLHSSEVVRRPIEATSKDVTGAALQILASLPER
jgi:hypothetical protein